MATLWALLRKTLKPLCAQNSYKEAMLIHDWEIIVGEELARGFAPLGVQKTSTGRTLRMQTSSSGMATVAYVEPMLLERINRFFGSNYITNIRTTQGQIKKSMKKKPVKVQFPEPETLDEALKILGQHLKGSDA